MQKHNNIKALFFLGIFSLLLLHNILPHIHHQHEVEHSHKAVAHSDSHGHEHDVPEKDNSKSGIFDSFLELHIHSVVSNENITTQESVKKLNFKKDVKAFISSSQYNTLIGYDETEKVRVYQPPNNYFNSYLSSLDSRGPPSLG